MFSAALDYFMLLFSFSIVLRSIFARLLNVNYFLSHDFFRVNCGAG